MLRVGGKLIVNSSWVLGLAVFFGGMPITLAAQSFYGSIVGKVTDPSGAVITGAHVMATSLGTAEKREAETDAAGTYRFVSLVPADYRLEVELGGFKRFVREPITVRVEGETRIDVVMTVGAATETVEVSTETPLLQTESGEVSDVVEGKQVQEMPLNGRNTMNLIALTPGVVAGAPSGASALNMGTHTSNGVWADYSIAGGFTGGNAMYLDGASVNLLGGNSIAFIPTQDAVQEFRIVSSGASPEFGRFGGGVINMTTKSGINQFHGTVYEYFRNNIFNANNFFSIQRSQPRPKWNQNQFGLTLGNPIVTNKVFSFFSWEGFRLLLGVPGQTNVPTQAIRNGTLTEPVGVTLHDPLQAQIGRTGCVTGSAVTGQWQINPSCFDATSSVMLNDWPLPNQPNNPASNFISTPVTGNSANQYTERVDFNLSEKQRLFARYTYWGQVDVPYNQLGNFTKNAFSHNRSHQGVIGDTYTINANSIVDLRLAYVRQFTDNQPFTLNSDLSSLGSAWAALQKQMYPVYMPGPHVLGAAGLYPFFGMEVYSQAYYNGYDLAGGLTLIKRNHNIKFGGEGRLSDAEGTPTTLNGGGNFTFLSLPFLSGDAFADFLLGVPASAAITKLSPSSTYNYYQGYYAADTWQAGPKLTLNLGLRWELPGVLAERNDKATVLLPNMTDPAANVKGALALVRSSLYPSRYIQGGRLNLFSPRLGFAYRLTETTSLRGSYSLTYYPPDLDAGVLASGSQVNSANTNWNNSPAAPFLTISNPFPSARFPNGLNSPTGRSVADLTPSLLGQTLVGPVPGQPYPWTHQWNVNIGHQFPQNWLLEAGYVGSSSQNLPTIIGLDELPSQYWSQAGAVQSNRPYGTSFTNVQNNNAHVGVSNYNSLQTKVQKRFGAGGVISGNYTYSKSLADVESPAAQGNLASAAPNTGSYIGYGPQDYANLRATEYSLSSFDVRHRAVISYVLDLPFGEGKRFARLNGVAGKLVSGWAVNGITNFQSGFPLSINQASSGNVLTSSFGAGTLRPNYVAGCSSVISGSAKNRLNEWFNTSCYTKVGSYSLGNEPRVDPKVRTDGVDNWDLSLLKTTKIRETANMQFRAEFFNTFNHPQFAAPGNAIDGANFGVVTAQFNNPRLVQFSLRINY